MDTWQRSSMHRRCNRTWPACPIRTTGVSGQRAASNTLLLTALSFSRAYKYVLGRFGECCLGTLNILTLLRAQQLPSHSSPLLDCIIEVRLSDPSAFACEIASTWHLCVYLLRDSCFSWWLPPHRRLGAAWRRFGTSGACSWPAPVL
jgi:hypothetical protein